MKILDFRPCKWILWVKKITARDVYFSAQGVQDLFPDPLNPSYTDVLELQFH